MKDEELIDKLEKSVVYIEDNFLYAINKHHTLLMRFKLKNKYPKMCFATSKWLSGAEFYINKDGKYKVRTDTIVLRKDSQTITIPQMDIDLKSEYKDLINRAEMQKLFNIDKGFYKTIHEYNDTSSFCKIELERMNRKLSLYDTSKDRTIVDSRRSLIPNEFEGKWFLPTTELDILQGLGFKKTEVFGNDDYMLFKEPEKEAIVSSMYITK